MHRDDLKRMSHGWLSYTEDVRNDTEVRTDVECPAVIMLWDCFPNMQMLYAKRTAPPSDVSLSRGAS